MSNQDCSPPAKMDKGKQRAQSSHNWPDESSTWPPLLPDGSTEAVAPSSRGYTNMATLGSSSSRHQQSLSPDSRPGPCFQRDNSELLRKASGDTDQEDLLGAQAARHAMSLRPSAARPPPARYTSSSYSNPEDETQDLPVPGLSFYDPSAIGSSPLKAISAVQTSRSKTRNTAVRVRVTGQPEGSNVSKTTPRPITHAGPGAHGPTNNDTMDDSQDWATETDGTAPRTVGKLASRYPGATRYFNPGVLGAHVTGDSIADITDSDVPNLESSVHFTRTRRKYESSMFASTVGKQSKRVADRYTPSQDRNLPSGMRVSTPVETLARHTAAAFQRTPDQNSRYSVHKSAELENEVPFTPSGNREIHNSSGGVDQDISSIEANASGNTNGSIRNSNTGIVRGRQEQTPSRSVIAASGADSNVGGSGAHHEQRALALAVASHRQPYQYTSTAYATNPRQSAHHQSSRYSQMSGHAMGTGHCHDETNATRENTAADLTVSTKFSFSLIPIDEAQRRQSSLLDEEENNQRLSAAPSVMSHSSYGSERRLTKRIAAQPSGDRIGESSGGLTGGMLNHECLEVDTTCRESIQPQHVTHGLNDGRPGNGQTVYNQPLPGLPTQPSRAHLPIAKAFLDPFKRLFSRSAGVHTVSPFIIERASVESDVELGRLPPLRPHPVARISLHPGYRHTESNGVYAPANETSEFPSDQATAGLDSSGVVDCAVEGNRVSGFVLSDDNDAINNVAPARPLSPYEGPERSYNALRPGSRLAQSLARSEVRRERRLALAREQARTDCRLYARANSRMPDAGAQFRHPYGHAHTRLTQIHTADSGHVISRTQSRPSRVRGPFYIPTNHSGYARVESPHLVPSTTPYALFTADRARTRLFCFVLVVIILLPFLTPLVFTSLMGKLIGNVTCSLLDRFTKTQRCVLRRVALGQVILLLGVFVSLVWWSVVAIKL